MPIIPKITKGPSASYTHSLDFSGWPQLQGDSPDTLVSATASYTGSDAVLVLGSVTVNATDNLVLIPLSVGTLGVTYRITALALTNGGDTLDGYLDVLIAIGSGDGAVVYPSQLVPYLDGTRAMELLFDDGELDDDEEPPSSESIDGNTRAFLLCQSAWRAVLEAATRGLVYSLTELTDLANDSVRGADLIALVADVFWCKLLRRRRYVSPEPQGKDSTCEEAENRLQLLRTGERIFDLEGVVDSSTGVARTNLLGAATALSVGRMGGRCHDTDRFFACTDCHRCGCSPCACGSGGCGSGWGC